MISLQIEGSRFGLVAIESASGRSWQLDVIVVHPAVSHNGHMPADQSDVEACPFAQIVLSACRWRIPAVDGSHLVGRQLAAFGAHLHLITTAQIDSAVATLRTLHFNM